MLASAVEPLNLQRRSRCRSTGITLNLDRQSSLALNYCAVCDSPAEGEFLVSISTFYVNQKGQGLVGLCRRSGAFHCYPGTVFYSEMTFDRGHPLGISE